jgi:hypothetical protein
MKFLINFFSKFKDKDFDQKVKRAKVTSQMIIDSTNGSINHFYNMDGEKIRGFNNKVIKTKPVSHPLMLKYK